MEGTQRLQAAQQRRDASKEHLRHVQKSLSAVGAGVEHLAGRLRHIKLVNNDRVHCVCVCVCGSMRWLSCLSPFPPSSRQKREDLRSPRTQTRLCSHAWPSLS